MINAYVEPTNSPDVFSGSYVNYAKGYEEDETKNIDIVAMIDKFLIYFVKSGDTSKSIFNTTVDILNNGIMSNMNYNTSNNNCKEDQFDTVDGSDIKCLSYAPNTTLKLCPKPNSIAMLKPKIAAYSKETDYSTVNRWVYFKFQYSIVFPGFYKNTVMSLDSVKPVMYKVKNDKCPLNIGDDDIFEIKFENNKKNYYYTGKEIIPKVSIKKHSDKNDLSCKYYNVKYTSNVNPGTAVATITGKGEDYAGSKIIYYNILLEPISTLSISEKKSTGLKISWNKVKNIDGYEIKLTNKQTNKTTTYTVKNTETSKIFTNLDNGGKYFLSINTYKNIRANNKVTKYTSTIKNSDVITLPCTNISSATVSTSQKEYIYTGSAIKPNVTVKLNGSTLKNGTDYTVAYKDNVRLGTGSVVVTGKGNYSGSKTVKFTIKSPQIEKVKNLKLASKTPTSLTVNWNKISRNISGYELVLTDTTNPRNQTKKTFKVKSTDTSKTFTGLQVCHRYDVSIRVYLTGQSNCVYGAYSYCNNNTLPSNKIGGYKISYRNTWDYTGKEIRPIVTVKNYDGYTLQNGRDYKITYKNNILPGTATMSIQGIGNYKGVSNLTFKIQVQVSKVTGLKTTSNSVSIKWDQSKQANGYCVEIVRYDSYHNKKVISQTLSANSITSTTFNKLLSDTDYDITIRAYRTVGKNTYYSGYTYLFKVTTK